MGQDSKIGWTNHTFNGLRGCVRVPGSPACEAPDGGVSCYAEAMARRNPAVLGTWGPEGRRVFAGDDYWRKPLAWNEAAKAAGVPAWVFTTAFGDWFEGVSERCPTCDGTGRARRIDPASDACATCGYSGWVERRDGVRPDFLPHLDRLWRTMRATPWLRWQVLSKRPWNMARYAAEAGWPDNAIAGATAETQALADERAAALFKVPADVRFLSIEPLVEAVSVGHLLTRYAAPKFAGQRVHPNGKARAWHGIDWVIVGCASAGPREDKRRPMREEWARTIRDECAAAEVPFFYKQAAVDGKIVHGPELDGRTCLQFPEVTHAA